MLGSKGEATAAMSAYPSGPFPGLLIGLCVECVLADCYVFGRPNDVRLGGMFKNNVYTFFLSNFIRCLLNTGHEKHPKPNLPQVQRANSPALSQHGCDTDLETHDNLNSLKRIK